MTKKINCKEAIMNEFEANNGMKTAEMLKERKGFENWALSTIKTALSKLKKEEKLDIGFRTRSTNRKEISLEGSIVKVKGKCYYKLN